MRIRNKLLTLYILGGLLPLLIFGFVMIRTGHDNLLRQAKINDARNLKNSEREMTELMDSVSMASRYFIFDPELEKISSHNYENYVELVRDYNSYKRFSEYGTLYADLVTSFSIYMNNPTIRSNANFVYTDEQIREEPWYRQAAAKNQVMHWLVVPKRPNEEAGLALTRRIVTGTGRPVGILVMHVRESRLEEVLKALNGSGFLLNGGEALMLAGGTGTVSYDDLKAALDAAGGLQAFAAEHALADGGYQGNLEVAGEDYLLTGIRLDSESYAFAEELDIVALHPYRTILLASFRQTRHYYLFLSLSAVTAFLLIAVFSKGFADRIRHFRAAIEKTAQGEYGFTQKLKGSDEIAELYNHLGSIIHQMQAMNVQIQEEKLKSEKLRTAQREAELKMLNMQINPHFLYNTLETIRMRARLEQQYEIEETVKRLAKLLRYTLEVGDKDVPLKRELEAVEAYLLIQQERKGGRFSCRIEVPEELKNCRVMPLLIQPLAENAMIHALEDIAEGGELLIKVEEQAGDLCVSVKDNGPGIAAERLRLLRETLDQPAEEGQHIGLKNVHQRLRLRYGEPYGLMIESVEGQGTCMRLTMPLLPADSAENREV